MPWDLRGFWRVRLRVDEMVFYAQEMPPDDATPMGVKRYPRGYPMPIVKRKLFHM